MEHIVTPTCSHNICRTTPIGAASKPRSGLGGIAADPLNRAAVADFTLPPASIAGLTPDYFDAAFSSSTRKTQYRRYLIERRVYYAKELLRHVSVSAAEVAREVGFSSRSHRTATFRKITSISLSEFRNRSV
jgi:methylphosphotriester-DNA--protein-cysteine methyltransferase